MYALVWHEYQRTSLESKLVIGKSASKTLDGLYNKIPPPWLDRLRSQVIRNGYSKRERLTQGILIEGWSLGQTIQK